MRTKRALALVLIIIVSASLLAGLYLPRLFYRRGVIIVKGIRDRERRGPNTAHQRLVLGLGLGPDP